MLQDFEKIIYNLLPGFLRKPKILALLNSAASELQRVNNLFANYRDNTLYFLQFDSRTIYFERYLNDQFDPINRAIFITTDNTTTATFLRNKIEARPKYIIYNKSEGQTPKYLRNKDELSNAVNYTINVPTAVLFTDLQITDKANQFNLAGKIFNIVRF